MTIYSDSAFVQVSDFLYLVLLNLPIYFCIASYIFTILFCGICYIQNSLQHLVSLALAKIGHSNGSFSSLMSYYLNISEHTPKYICTKELLPIFFIFNNLNSDLFVTVYIRCIHVIM